MNTLSIGKIRGLQQIAGLNGIFSMCAMDHRGSLEGQLCPPENHAGCPREMTDFKLELCETLAPQASAVLLDPIYGAAQCIVRNLIPKTCGLLVSLEATGYSGTKFSRETKLLDGWGVAKVKGMGASAAKMLVYYRPDLEEVTNRQLKLVQEIGMKCQLHDIPFLVEPVSYPVEKEIADQEGFARAKSRLVIQTAKDMTSMPVDVLKAEFPADISFVSDDADLLRFCEKLNAASTKPWVILSAGASFEPFIKEVELACRGGASGFLAGRAVWQEAVAMTDPSSRHRFLTTVAADRLKRLTELADKFATPWYKKLGFYDHDLGDITQNWHSSYGEAM
jgi:tagatose 1,6-diphosphate aldolase